MADDQGIPSDGDLLLTPTTVVRTPRRRALWGALAVVAVAAGALAINAGGGDPGVAPVLPVALGAGGRAEGAGAADASMAWSAVTYVAGDGLPALGGEAPAYRLTGSVDEARVRALADELGLSGDLTHDERSWRMASPDGYLEVYEDGGGSWWYSQAVVGYATDGGTSGGAGGCEGGPAVDCAAVDPPMTVDPATTVPADECATLGTDCATTTVVAECGPNAECVDPMPPECAPDTGCVAPPPIEPSPPADLPTKDAARQIALDLLSATGMDVDGAKITVEGPYEAWSVTVEPVLGGVPVSGWVANVAVGSKGVVTNASGTLGQPESLDDYPLIDTRAAVNRLNEQQSYLVAAATPPLGAPGTASSGGGVAIASGPPSVLVPGPGPESVASCAADSATGTTRCDDVAVGDAPPPVECLQPVPTDPASPTSTGCGPDVCVYSEGPVTTVVVPPCDPGPAPEPVTVTLTGAERVLVLMPASDGSGDAYLVPGYRFSNDDGAMAEIAAVADDSLAPTTTVPADPTDPTEPTDPAECDVVVEDDGSGTTHTVDSCPRETRPSEPELTHLSDGEEPQVGVAYYVDLTVMTGHCSWVTAQVGERWWIAEMSNEELARWSTPTEGGSFTLVDADHATFVGDAEGTKVAQLTARDGEPGCA